MSEIDNAIADLRQALPPGQPCTLIDDIAALIAREFSIEARIKRAERQHRRRSHLRAYLKQRKTQQLAA